MSGERRLIVNADDFGRSPGINLGIIAAHAGGMVTSTTLMVNTAWAEDALRLAAAYPRLAIGLHLNLCYGMPVCDPERVPSLIRPDGSFETDLERLAARACKRDIATEVLAQLQRFEELAGRAPAHLDSHKYVHSREPFATPVARVASCHGLVVRATHESDRRRLRALGVHYPDRFVGRFHGAEGDGVSVAVLESAIERLENGTTELMCHPGYVDMHLMDSSYRDDRERELGVLCDPRIARLIERCGITLATFADLERLKP
jgi:predicted glycoside hydrolase/deacetylase ChbG (UPF0249 family)